ncbi:protein kinase domain-containing protein [Babesia gibsoni]|uniref:non-specific serine/threonine protein kinase n=1 Tax=Babesia gibsoni TaxID=33632 RepID=A0AAD8PFU2_BABGI|nr:protein kinase domain-containing protein [Babesia gibsoni]
MDPVKLENGDTTNGWVPRVEDPNPGAQPATCVEKKGTHNAATSTEAVNALPETNGDGLSLSNVVEAYELPSYGSSVYGNSNYDDDYDSAAHSNQDVYGGSNCDGVSTPNSGPTAMSDTFDCNLSESEDPESYVPGGYHPVKVGEVYDGRYRIEGKLGWGYFSTVWLAADIKRKPLKFVAIKFQRSAPSHTDAICDEMDLLKKVRDEVICRKWVSSKKIYKEVLGDLYNSTRGVVSYLNWFTVRGPNGRHVCVVLEPMGPNILSLIKLYKFKGVPLPLVRKITAHVLLGLDYLHRICGIIHTDLKPENILVTSKLSNSTPLEHLSKNQVVKQYLDDKASTCIPYVKDEIKSCRSDPSLLTSFDEAHALQETLMRKPYDHIVDYIMQPLKSLGIKQVTDNCLYHPAVSNILGLSSGSNPKKKHRVVVKTEQGKVQVKPVDILTFNDKEAVFKICDLGNSCWIQNHFTDEIQTRQYRAPETILQCGYDQSADIWSLACIVFELITGDYLFDPHGGNSQERDINHLQLIVELLGPIPKHMIRESPRMKHHEREINDVKRWPLDSVLVKKYKLEPTVAKSLTKFLLSMLKTNPKSRPSAEQLIHSEWLLEQVQGENTSFPSNPTMPL